MASVTLLALLSSKQWIALLLTCILIWLVVVRVTRYQRAGELEKKYAPHGRQSFRHLTADDAQEILKTLAELEFPILYGFSMVVALFRTYGIPTISSLLVSTGQLKNKETASKRAADTGVLLLEFGLNKPTSERAIEAIARMNFLHSRYQKSGKITNDDLLYTLGIFALEPSRWINRYEWRHMSELELCACGTYWKNMGDAMEISYSKLPSFSRGWADGLQWLDEVRRWSDHYEEICMVPAETNRNLTDAQFDYILPNWPTKYRDPCKNLAVALLGERLRWAVMYPKSPPIYHNVVNAILFIRKLVIRHFTLPRPNSWRKLWIEAGKDDRNGRLFLYDYLAHPWLFGYSVPGDDGNRYHPQGYTFAEIGPQALSGKGTIQMDETRARLVRAERGGCPFSPPR
ncbi:MAG: hypothetical protein Q9169_007404 [Polycauliona sp. 2 TL-2023]